MKRLRSRRFRRAAATAGVIGVAIAIGLVLSGGASPSPSNKNYSASISPSVANAGSATDFTVTITNLASSTQSVGSANVTFPAGFTLPQGAVAAANVTPPPGKSWTATVIGNVVQLRNPGPNTTKALAPGQSVSVKVPQVVTPASCGSFSLTTQAKQANDFSGPPGNDFTRVGAEPSVTVGSGALASLTWTTQPGATQTAGSSFGGQIMARDACGNVKTNYTGANVAWSGLGTSPNNTAPSYSITWSNGVGTATFVDYRAESGVAITIADGAVQATSSSFDVAPGALAAFSWTTQPGANQTAGSPFGAAVTASDTWGNTISGYSGNSGGFGVSGLHTSPNGTAPLFGSVSWSNGVGTISGLEAFKAETANLVASDGSVQGTSSSITVAPGPLASLTWTQQPAEAQKLVTLSPAPAVTAKDAYGNTIAGANVGVGLTALSGTGTFTQGSTTSATTDGSGVASFGNLAVSDVGQYDLVATSGAVSQPSSAFVIANQVNPCNGSCNANGSTNTTTSSASATNAPSGSSLGVAVIANDTVPTGVCGGFGFAQLGAGSFVNVVASGGGVTPNFTITWTLDKSVVKAAGNPGATHFDICLGAENLLDPLGLTTIGWTTKLSTPAQPFFDPSGVVLWWGIVPDCPSPSSGPCVQSKHKDNAGDEVITFLKPSPWDGHYFGGGP